MRNRRKIISEKWKNENELNEEIKLQKKEKDE